LIHFQILSSIHSEKQWNLFTVAKITIIIKVQVIKEIIVIKRLFLKHLKVHQGKLMSLIASLEILTVNKWSLYLNIQTMYNNHWFAIRIARKERNKRIYYFTRILYSITRAKWDKIKLVIQLDNKKQMIQIVLLLHFKNHLINQKVIKRYNFHQTNWSGLYHQYSYNLRLRLTHH